MNNIFVVVGSGWLQLGQKFTSPDFDFVPDRKLQLQHQSVIHRFSLYLFLFQYLDLLK